MEYFYQLIETENTIDIGSVSIKSATRWSQSPFYDAQIKSNDTYEALREHEQRQINQSVT